MTTTERSRTKRNRGSQLLPIACMTVLAPVLMAEFSHPKISRDLAMAADAPDVDVLVQFSGPPSSADIASVVSHGGRVKQVFSNMSSTLVTVPGRALASIVNRAQVRYISPNRPLTGKLE